MAKTNPESLQEFAVRMGLRKIHVDVNGTTVAGDYPYAAALSDLMESIRKVREVGDSCLRSKPKIKEA